MAKRKRMTSQEKTDKLVKAGKGQGKGANAYYASASLIGQSDVGGQKDGFLLSSCPPGNHRHRPVAFLGKPNVGHTDQINRLNQ